MYGLAGGSFTVTDAADACGGDSPHAVTASVVAIRITNLKAPLLRGMLSPTSPKGLLARVRGRAVRNYGTAEPGLR